MLGELGHKTLAAASAGQALSMLNENGANLDLLITDYAMPKTSGIELILKARAVRPELPAIIITGYMDEELLGRRPDDVCVLAKPFTATDLENAIFRTIKGHSNLAAP